MHRVMKRVEERLLRSSLLFFVAMTGNCSTLAVGFVTEFRFVIHDVEGDAAAWSPREVVIHRGADLGETLLFVLENPTARTHVLEAPGLFEQIVEGPEAPTVKPLRVYVPPGETVHVRVSTERLKRTPGMGASGTESFQFFCPLHGHEEALRSTIRVSP